MGQTEVWKYCYNKAAKNQITFSHCYWHHMLICYLHIVIKKKPQSRKEAEAVKKKKRKSNTGKKRAAAEVNRSDPFTEDDDMSNKPLAKGTIVARFVKFINKLLDVMDMDDMKRH